MPTIQATVMSKFKKEVGEPVRRIGKKVLSSDDITQLKDTMLPVGMVAKQFRKLMKGR